MLSERTDNYEKLLMMWRQRFLEMDEDALLRKLPELKAEGCFLTIRHFGRRLGISRTDGSIHPMDDTDPVSSTSMFNVYTLLYYSRPGARLTGEWKPFPQLKDGGNYGPAYEKTTMRDFAATFSGHTDLLEEAFRKMGGTKFPLSDVGYEVKAFECIPVRFFYWDADDEFPAQGNILFDTSCTDFIHIESIVSIAGEGIHRLAALAGLPIISG